MDNNTAPFILLSTLNCEEEDMEHPVAAAQLLGKPLSQLLYSDGEVTDEDAHEEVLEAIVTPKSARGGRLWKGTYNGQPIAGINIHGCTKLFL